MGSSKNRGKKHESCNESRNENRKHDFNIRAKFNRDDFCDAVRECREKKHESSSCEKRKESSSCEKRNHHKKRCCRCRRFHCCCRSSW